MDLSKILCGVKYSGFINAVLQNIVRQKDNLSSSNWDIKNNYPKWMLNSWEKQYGKIKTTKILKVLNKEPCLLYTSPSPRDMRRSRMPSSA